MISRRSVLQGLAAMPFAGVAGAGFAAQTPTGPFTLPALAYPFAALEPHIDAETMQIHHDRHHQTYVTNLNVALAKIKVPPAGTENLSNAIELVKMLGQVSRRCPPCTAEQWRWPREPHDVLVPNEAWHRRCTDRPDRGCHQWNLWLVRKVSGCIRRCRPQALRFRVGLARENQGR